LFTEVFTSLLLKDVFISYEAFQREATPSLERSRPYKDYIGWLQEQDLEQAESYLGEKLKGFRAPTEMGLERVRG
jgi:hypothetical protein